MVTTTEAQRTARALRKHRNHIAILIEFIPESLVVEIAPANVMSAMCPNETRTGGVYGCFWALGVSQALAWVLVGKFMSDPRNSKCCMVHPLGVALTSLLDDLNQSTLTELPWVSLWHQPSAQGKTPSKVAIRICRNRHRHPDRLPQT